ncbi:MAG TPA: phosphatase PAP2 family protein [Sphingobacteriaceae bacterium]|nr:phosphatase PAP2 family protein [Sphingobacteriaceae bacterium]
MFSLIKKVYRRFFAAFLLLAAEITLASVSFFIALAGFLFIAKYVFLDNKLHFDLSAFLLMDHFINDRNNQIIAFLTKFGNHYFLITANLVLIAYFLFIRKHRWYSIKIPAVALGSVIVMSLLKMLFNRPRPLIPLLEPAMGLSFPSGHAMSSVTFYGLLIYFVWRRREMNNALKVGIVIFLTLFILAIGLSRIYLRVHYASDVIAGFCLGIIWLIIAIFTINKIQAYTRRNLTKVVDNPITTDSDKITQ